jgi:hypothetical protein
MRLIKLAENSFSELPWIIAGQTILDRQAKTRARKEVLTMAAQRLHAKPRAPNMPHMMESAPKVPPDIRAVLAFSGFDK